MENDNKKVINKSVDKDVNKFVKNRRTFKHNLIRTIRTYYQLTLSDMAHLFNVSKTFIWEIEMGKKDMSTDFLIKFCLIFNCSSDEVLGLKPYSFPKEKKIDIHMT